MDKANTNVWQCLDQSIPGRLGRLNIQRIALFNRRANPIRLATLLARCPHPADDRVSTTVVDQGGRDRLAARRQFIDDRAVQVAVSHHG